MKIVVTDGYTLNPGDLSWQELRAQGNCEIYDRTEPHVTIERCLDAQLVLTNKVVMSREVIEALPNLRYIGVLATGYNVVDLQAAAERNVVVTNIPAYGPASVAQFVFALLLNRVQPVDFYRDQVRQGRWAKSADFCFYDHSMPELARQTLGVIGYGAIGRQVAQIATGFGMQVLVTSRTRPAQLPPGVTFVSQDELIRRSDFVSLHCPLTSDNVNMVDRAFMQAMKPSAYLINTARGPLVDEPALAEALRSRRIAGAALDVLTEEPPASDNALVALDNCVITPHIAWSTVHARQRLMSIAVDNVAQFLAGSPVNVVN